MYKIKLTRGCIKDSLTVNGKEFVDMDLPEIKTIITDILNNESDDMLIREIIDMIVTYKGIETDYYRCDCCGDYVETYELTI